MDEYSQGMFFIVGIKNIPLDLESSESVKLFSQLVDESSGA